MPKLSIIIPVYNEERTVGLLLKKVVAAELMDGVEKELIVVDDCSRDRSAELVDQFIQENPHVTICYHRQPVNQGKGAAIHQGFKLAQGDFLVVQDADLEYDPADYNALLAPMLHHGAHAVYGSRFVSGKPHRVLFFWHSIGNKFLTMLSNMFTNLNLTDMETCYKMFRREVIEQITLREKRFGFEPEVTAKIARIPGIVVYEVGISYFGRTYEEGKKINWRDGFRAIWCIIKYG